MLVGLALDAQNLMFILHHEITGWVLAPLLVAHLSLGILAGVLYFRALRRAADIFSKGGSAASPFMLGGRRFAGLGLILFLAAMEGAAPLLCMAAGVMFARFVMLRMSPRIAT
jgi:hypothetical protein